eukprot:6332814-Prymnesium_polylepis.1
MADVWIGIVRGQNRTKPLVQCRFSSRQEGPRSGQMCVVAPGTPPLACQPYAERPPETSEAVKAVIHADAFVGCTAFVLAGYFIVDYVMAIQYTLTEPRCACAVIGYSGGVGRIIRRTVLTDWPKNP